MLCPLFQNRNHFLVSFSSYGSGIFVSSSTVSLNNSTVSDNIADSLGGGIYLSYGSTLNINNSTIANNTSPFGGGIYLYDGTTLTINNSTISGNTASTLGGGILQGQFAGYTNTIALHNTILANNTAATAPDCSGFINTSDHNIIGNTTGCTVTAGTGDQFNVDPQLSTFLPAQGYYPLLLGSPAIEAGDNATCMATDQRGVARVGTCDIGAYEYTTPGSAVSLSVVSGSGQRAGTSSAFSQPLQAAALDSQGSPVGGVTIDFTAPGSGPSGTFADTGTNTTSVDTDAGGIATTPIFTANNQSGNYNVTATASGLADSVTFTLTNALPWYVSTTGNDANDCLGQATTCATINGALNKPDFVAGDTILVAMGTYTGTGNEVVLLDKDATLSGGWDETFTTQSGMTTIDGGGSQRGITVNTGVTANVTRFTIQNSGGSEGYGVHNSGTLTLDKVHIHNTIRGILNNNTGTLTLNNSAITDNGSIETCGGGIFNDRGTVTINNSTISGNASSSVFCAPIAGIANHTGPLALNNVTVANNTGGGIWSFPAGVATLQNTLVAGNTLNGNPYDCNAGDVLNSLGYNLMGAAPCTVNSTTGDQIGTLNSPINGDCSTATEISNEKTADFE